MSETLRPSRRASRNPRWPEPPQSHQQKTAHGSFATPRRPSSSHLDHPQQQRKAVRTPPRPDTPAYLNHPQQRKAVRRGSNTQELRDPAALAAFGWLRGEPDRGGGKQATRELISWGQSRDADIYQPDTGNTGQVSYHFTPRPCPVCCPPNDREANRSLVSAPTRSLRRCCS